MLRILGGGLVALLLLGCPTAPEDGDGQPRLEVTARSATTLTLRWPSMGSTDTYTVDYLTGVASCDDWPPHSDVFRVTGTQAQLTGLAPSTRYHIHVHLLPHETAGSDASTTVVFVTTLPSGSAEQAVSSADYQSCASKG